MKNSKIKTIIIGISTLLLTTGCEDSTGPTTPEDATISGTITFSGAWPDTGTVEVSAMEIWDHTLESFTGIPEISKVISQSDVTANTYTYTLDMLPFKTYNAIIVTWRDPIDPDHSTMYHTLGAYGGTYPFYTSYGGADPTALTVSDTLNTLSEINFSADLKYVIACSKIDNQIDCEDRDYCNWYPADAMGSGTPEQCR